MYPCIRGYPLPGAETPVELGHERSSNGEGKLFRTMSPRERKPASGSGPCGAEGVLLQAAIDVLKRNVVDCGAESRSQIDSDQARRREVAVLESWADEVGLWLDQKSITGLRDPRTREHVLFRSEHAPDRIFKLTKESVFGLYPRCLPENFWRKNCRYWFGEHGGTPCQYLKRLSLTNSELLGDLPSSQLRNLNRLEGFVRNEGQFQIVSSQPFLDGEPASVNEIAKWFSDRGFVFIREFTWFRPSDGLAVFDTWMHNLMKVQGVIIPFDVIPVQAEGQFLEKLLEAANR